MSSTLSSLVRRGTSFLTPNGSSANLHTKGGVFSKAPEGTLFPKVDPAVDGEDCDHDCASCTIKYPAKFSIDEKEVLYGHVKGWSTHLLVATGKSDWVRDVEDEKGSVMEAVGRTRGPENGRLMLSASNIPTPSHTTDYSQPTTCLLLPAFTLIENVTPASVPDLVTSIINHAPTNTTLLPSSSTAATDPTTTSSTNPPAPTTLTPLPSHLSTRPSPHAALILLCSQRTRDARCGQSAPLLKREFERHLRPLGLYRDLEDERPGGVGIYFISHVGGHKFSANVMVYRRSGFGSRRVVEGGGGIVVEDGEEAKEGVDAGSREGGSGDAGAGQCIWLARVRPEDCEGIVKFTVLQGKVVKPERQLRGGFDREKGLVSW